MKNSILFGVILYILCLACFFNANYFFNFSISESLQTVEILMEFAIIVVLMNIRNVKQTNN